MLRPMKNVFRKCLVRYTSEYLSTTVIYLMDVFLSVVASGIVILCFYNGQKTRSGRKGSKWAFYLFYPIHLLVIGCLKMFL